MKDFGGDTDEIIDTVFESGGLPVLSWAPGKWFFRRGQVIRELLDSHASDHMLIGDTTLRPTIWSEPRLMRYARGKGFRIVAGSDPLPFSGEESFMGMYGTWLEGKMNGDTFSDSVRSLLMDRTAATGCVGTRCGLLTVLRRLKKNYTVKKVSA